MGIGFGSIGTGLPKNIVQQIIEAEKIPIRQMETRKGKIAEKKSLVQQVTKLVENLRSEVLKNKNARSLRELTVNTGGSQAVKVSADKNIAQPAKYQLEILRMAKKSSALTNGVEDKDETYTGVGYIGVTLPNGEEKEIYIDDEHANLTGIAKLINRNENLGIQATVINDGKGGDQPWHLMISMSDTGDNQKVTFPNLYLLDGEVDLYFDQERDAKDALIKLDGFEIEVPGNRVTDLIPGVTIDLQKTTEGKEITLEINEDIQKIGEKIKVIIDSLNNILTFIKQQNNLNEKTDTSRTLGGDSMLQTIESRIRSSVFTTVDTDSGKLRIGDLGVNFQRDGLLQFDQTKFQSMLAQDFKGITQVLVGKFSLEEGKVKGFIDVLDETARLLLAPPSGTLPNRKKGLDNQIRQIDRALLDL